MPSESQLQRKTFISLALPCFALALAMPAGAGSVAYMATVTGQFGTVDLATGQFTQLGNMGLASPRGLGEVGGALYTADSSATSNVYKVDPTNGKLIPMGNAGIFVDDLGSTTSGLFAVDTNANLYSINPSSGAATLIGPTGLSFSIGALGMSTGSDTLYLANGVPGTLYSLNTTTGAATPIGGIGAAMGAMVFESGTLYGGAFDSLYTLDTTTGGGTFVVNASGAATIYGLAPPVCTPPPPGMVSWWPGDGNANDIVGHNNGTLVGGVTFEPGEVGQAFSLDGATGFVQIPGSAALQPPTAISIDAWVYPKAFPPPTTTSAIISKYDSANGGGFSWDLSVQSTGQVEWYVIGPTQNPSTQLEVVTLGALSLGAWQHIAATFDTATQAITVYINGVQVPTTCGICGTVTSIYQSSANVLIGALISGNPGAGPSNFWSGLIDEVEVFNGVLPADSINKIYKAGSAGKCKVGGCQVDACGNGVTDGCVKVSNLGTEIVAKFIAPSGLTLAKYASSCALAGFDWQQVITKVPCPSAVYANDPSALPYQDICSDGSLTAVIPFNDPPSGGYASKPGNPYPFYYALATALAQEQFPTGACIINGVLGGCIPLVSPDGTTLAFYDAPADPCLPGGSAFDQFRFCFGVSAPPATFMAFTTTLSGIYQGGTQSPLFHWSWTDTFNGTSGGIATTYNDLPTDPGSGTGGITITDINGTPQTPPSINCTASPSTLWPPNGKPVLVTVSGIVTPGTQAIPPGGTAYVVIDEYGQVQPSGTFALGAGGTYSFGVSLIAARNGNDKDGRTYTIVVGATDNIGNLGSCSAVVTVPHDQGN